MWESHFFDRHCGVWFEVINSDAKSTRHQGESKSGEDAGVRHGIFQSSEALREDIQQQRHQTQGCNVGASGHHNAGRAIK